MSTEIEQNEQLVAFLDTLEPAERDEYRRLLQKRKNMKPVESLESLCERLDELRKQNMGPTPEKKKITAEIDRRLVLGAEHKLRLFINDELEKGGALDMSGVKRKAKDLGIQNTDLTNEINVVATLRDRFSKEGE